MFVRSLPNPQPAEGGPEVTLAYERAGSGPPLVLMHGVGHRRQAWGAVIDRLTPHREVITVDLPGHGESPPLELAGRDAADALEDELAGTFGQLGLDRPHVAGNSLGGRLALEAAVRGRAATVTALSPAGFWSNDRDLSYTKAIFRSMQAAGKGIRPLAPALSRSTAGRALMCGTIVARPSRMSAEQASGDLTAFLAAGGALTALLDAATEFTGEIPGDVPVTIAWGTRDRLLRPHQAKIAQKRLPKARFVPLPGCGHVPMTDDPQLVADVLLRGSSEDGAERGAGGGAAS
jgi:pimeloyl-ACP methyl ester carboxylesterase